MTTKVKGLILLKRPLQFQRMYEEIFHFQFYNASRGGFSFSNFTKFSSWTEFHFKILKVHFFQIEGFVFSLHLAIFTIQTAFLHNEMGMFYQKNTFFCVFEPYLNKPQLPLYINCPPPSHNISLGCFITQKSCFFAQKSGGSSVSHPLPPSPTAQALPLRQNSLISFEIRGILTKCAHSFM